MMRWGALLREMDSNSCNRLINAKYYEWILRGANCKHFSCTKLSNTTLKINNEAVYVSKNIYRTKLHYYCLFLLLFFCILLLLLYHICKLKVKRNWHAPTILLHVCICKRFLKKIFNLHCFFCLLKIYGLQFITWTWINMSRNNRRHWF